MSYGFDLYTKNVVYKQKPPGEPFPGVCPSCAIRHLGEKIEVGC